ncbi:MULTISPECIES: NCS2 family permease [Caproicibacterium]|jgi:AGZA family xanthine/uracil permease-like MFS transporter|uniref:NCS2 family permease n=1 Tax=Caproicibacterium lactatifermentans TaxID=2666138 RepID=A0A859DT86_9FIRM|nr:NCS2 family permease [Caproicibacterium lactatifermentans]ARP50889.1 guanine permease [Ruminococcaceae bacterium CPB6]MDD4807361.1 NCS2 family permease [Oscillospiraceae bacterium]QKN23383.1 NCS2 family permease [Caproicibacterium lactatifermentans]QKO29939.1 NCS2 family permease [Caproicibacterium lactatifermentans]
MEETKKQAYHPKGDFFNLKGNGTNVHTEIMAGITTFFTMSYILFVNPQVLSKTGMDSQAVFLATIIAASIGTLVMALFANVPYAQAPGMGLNAFFTYTVCMSLHFTWQQALAMVFICGLINIIITVTKFRKLIIKSIPKSLQNAISGGIGIFVAYIGLKNANLIQFSTDSSSMVAINGQPYSATAAYKGITSVASNGGVVPSIATFNQPSVLVALFGIILIVILLMLNVKGAILIGIIATTVIGIPFGVTDFSGASITFGSLGTAFSKLGTTFGAAFSSQGMGSLFNDPSKFLLVIMTIFAFSLSDTFDTIGTFIGTGRRTGIFSEEDEAALNDSKGFNSKMDRALFADSIATSIGAIFGTSNTTTFVESAAGIGAGGRTGLTSLTTAIMFMLCTILAPVAGCIPAAATAPALIIVGIMMMSSFKEVNWPDMEEAIPAFGAAIFMALAYSISYGIAAGFIFYCIVKAVKGKFKDVHPILLVSAILFVLNFIVLAIL